MATYKVIQDIEAEDKLIGPLTLRQFIYAAIVLILSFIGFKFAQLNFVLIIPFLPPIIFFGLLAAPFGSVQSSEVWLLAKIRFFLKPRIRIWDQSEANELVTITAPKKIEQIITNGLSQDEVRSRLQALANTIDSRGWAVKNVNVNLFSQPSYVLDQTDSDRLIDPRTIPQDVPNYDASPVSDIMDESSNPTDQHIEQMITASEQAHRQQLRTEMQQHGSKNPGVKVQQVPADYYFMHQPDSSATPPGYAVFDNTQTVAPGAQPQPAASTTPSTDEEKKLLQHIHEEQARPDPGQSHLKTIEPLSGRRKRKNDQSQRNQSRNSSRAQATSTPDPAIIELANNDDRSVASLAREANKATKKQPPKDEVVISLR